jgi:mono/diheme cytochrome c family protein
LKLMASRQRNTSLIAGVALFAAATVTILAMVEHLPDVQISPTLAQRNPDRARGEYIAVLGDCAFCHTRPAGPAYAGGRALRSPIGVIYSSNITPDRVTGIGSYSLPDFMRVIRLGVTPDGTRLYPAMPYTAYAKVSDEDLQDLFAYLQSGPAPVRQASPAGEMVWPLNIRWPLAFWILAFHDNSRFIADASRSAQWNRGAYLVQGLAHCGACHTPRGLFFQEKDVSGKTTAYLSGTEFDGASPINLRGNSGDGLGRWSSSDLANLLKSGSNEHSAVTGAMADAVRHSTQYMTDDDVTAIAVYVKSLSPAPEDGRAKFLASDSTLRTVMAGNERSVGGRIYMDSCAACHRLSGQGENLTFPSLAGNPSVLSSNPASLIGVILGGARMPSTALAPTGLTMPGFDWRYDDIDIAAVATFTRSSWGNDAPPVSAAQVAKVRRQLGLSRPPK